MNTSPYNTTVTYATDNRTDTSDTSTALYDYHREPNGVYFPKLKPLRPDQINWNTNQNKIRKARRRAFAAGNKKAFTK